MNIQEVDYISKLNSFLNTPVVIPSIDEVTTLAMNALQQCKTHDESVRVSADYERINTSLKKAEIKKINDSCFSWLLEILAIFLDKYNTEKIHQKYDTHAQQVKGLFFKLDFPNTSAKNVTEITPHACYSDEEDKGTEIQIPNGLTCRQYEMQLQHKIVRKGLTSSQHQMTRPKRR